ncbi:MAG: aminoacyl-tRNA hydrolase [Planctomycetaceae bacterium]|nr:aminoacyl-tRNA hydrolase [Planctomycetaceae bacterium]
MKVVVGLGNPGREYERTRHNIGWMTLDVLAERLSATRFRRERSVEAAEATVDGEKVYLLKPQTFMNLSGQALASWLGWMTEVRDALKRREETPPAPEGPPPSKQDKVDDAECRWPGILVLTDDVNLPLGRMRLRPSGSAGGHNGLTDIEKALGGRGYPRLRLGVGAPPERMDRADYVLSRFAPDEAPVVRKVAEVASDAVRDWLREDFTTVRNRYNGLRLGGAE